MRPDAQALASVEYRRFTPDDIERVVEIDRSESIAMLYEVREGEIVPTGRGCEVPQWSGDWLAHEIALVRRHLEAGATGLGAYAGDRLVGLGVVGHAPVRDDAEEAQLVFLHVDRAYHRHGVAGRLVRELREAALRRGARRLYISATPSSSALGFYRSLGAYLAEPADPRLIALEPEDVHLILDL